MGTSLFNTTPAATYPALIKVGDNTSIDGTLKTLSDGAGNDLPIQVSSTVTNFTGNVGLGAVSPIAKLQVNGTQVITNADITGYTLYSSFNLVRNGATSIALDRFTGAPHFNFRAAGGTIASPSTQVGELGNIGWWSYSGTAFNRNVLLLADASNFVGGLAQTQRLSISMGESGPNSNSYFSMVNGDTFFGAGASSVTPTARLQVRGSGSTSATTSFLVQNSLGTEYFKLTDDAALTFTGLTRLAITTATQINSRPVVFNTNGGGGGFNGGYDFKSGFGGLDGNTALRIWSDNSNSKVAIGNIAENTLGGSVSKLYIDNTISGGRNKAIKLNVNFANISTEYNGIQFDTIENGSGGAFIGSQYNTATSGYGSDLAIFTTTESPTYTETARFVGKSQSLSIGAGKSPTARLQVKGSGTTSGTTAFLVQNSGGFESLKIQDNFQATFGNANSKRIILNPEGIGVYGDSSLITQGSSFSIESSSTANLSEIKDQVLILLASGSSDKLQIGSGGISATLANGDFSINSTTFGFKPPRMTTAERVAISSPANGLIVFDTDVQNLCYRRDSTWVQVSFTAV
jgi:hypothetical protein